MATANPRAVTRTTPMVYEEPQSVRPARATTAEPMPGSPFWGVAVTGIVILVFGHVASYVMTLVGNSKPGAQIIIWLTFYTFGSAVLAMGLAFGSLMSRGLSNGVRAALLLGAAFFAAGGLFSGVSSLVGLR